MLYEIIVQKEQEEKEFFFFTHFNEVVNFLAHKGIVIPLEAKYDKNQTLIFAIWKNLSQNLTATMKII